MPINAMQATSENCGGPHLSRDCQDVFTNDEMVMMSSGDVLDDPSIVWGHFRPEPNLYGNIYNSQFKNHPNYRWKLNNNNQGPSGYNQQQ